MTFIHFRRLARLQFLCLTGILLVLASHLRAENPAAVPLHFSLAEATCDRAQGRLLLTVRMQTSDLESTLSEQEHRRVSADSPADLAPLALDYVREHLTLRPRTGTAVRLEWAGQDVAGGQIFLYFEAPLPGAFEGATVSNTLLFEKSPDQINEFRLLDGALKATFVFSKDKPEQRITLKL